MVIVLLLAQVALVVLQYGAAVISVSPFLVFLPAMLIATLWLTGIAFGWAVNIDAWPVAGNLFEVPSRTGWRR